ncbi:MAG TPA: hypothetical protein PLQ97_07640 [Myxococcota bacterium]|nr:hypothetical protein [Myxococcota bacterium]HQK50507.1 hypothetical protein [Myxococcota bacterium]
MGRPGAWFAAILVAVALRFASGWPLVAGPEALPFPDDAPYHWIRLGALAAGPVDLQAPDPGSAWPEGVRAHWPWGFDLAMAALMRLAGASGDALFRFSSWAIPILGALLLPLVWVLARRLGGPTVAAIATALAAVMPFHVQYSMVGRVDHHVLEPISLAVAVSGLLPGTSWIGAGLSGLVQGISFALFPSALYPVLVVLTLGGPLAALRRPGPTSLWAIVTWAGAAASLTVSPYAQDWAFFAPSRTHLVLTGIGVLGVLGTAVARRLCPAIPPWRFPPAASEDQGGGAAANRARRDEGDGALPRWRTTREAIALGVGVAAAGVAGAALWWAFPSWVDSFREGIAYLGGSGFARLSFEARPLLSDPLRAWTLLGVAAPLGLAGIWRLAGPADAPPGVREARQRFALLALALSGGALLQRRFVMVAVPLLALAIAEGLVLLGSWAGARLTRRGVRRSLVGLLLGSGLVAILVQDARQALGLNPWQPRDQAFLQAARLISRRVQETPDLPPMGALAPWGAGHLVRWASGLPVVCDNFFGAPDHDRGLRNCLAFLLETDENRAIQMRERLQVRFALIAPPHPEEVRVMGTLMGLPEGSLVDDRDRFTARFARTTWVRLGRFASGSAPGSRGPLGSSLVGNVLIRDRDRGEVQAEVAVLEFGSGQPGSAGGLYPEVPSEENAARRMPGEAP